MLYIIIFIVVLNLAFILPRLLPGNFAQVSDLSFAQSQDFQQYQNQVEARLGLNQSMSYQYIAFLKGMFLTWPPYLGVSFLYYPETVTNLVATRLPWTMLLILSSLAIALGIMFLVGGYTATRRGSFVETLAQYISVAVHSTPIFWVAMIMVWVLGVDAKWFPVFGNVGVTVHGTANYLISVVWHAVLPVASLSLAIFGEHYLLLRGSIQEVLQSDYVLAAKGRGLKQRLIATRYILRNSLLPLVSILSFSIAKIIGLVILVEKVFGYPGLGDLIVDAISGRDYPVLQGSLFYFTLIVILGGLIGDFIMVRLNPNLRHQ